eukprot:jgi/Ulvmu1/6981/UM033_0039.1
MNDIMCSGSIIQSPPQDMARASCGDLDGIGLSQQLHEQNTTAVQPNSTETVTVSAVAQSGVDVDRSDPDLTAEELPAKPAGPDMLQDGMQVTPPSKQLHELAQVDVTGKAANVGHNGCPESTPQPPQVVPNLVAEADPTTPHFKQASFTGSGTHGQVQNQRATCSHAGGGSSPDNPREHDEVGGRSYRADSTDASHQEYPGVMPWITERPSDFGLNESGEEIVHPSADGLPMPMELGMTHDGADTCMHDRFGDVAATVHPLHIPVASAEAQNGSCPADSVTPQALHMDNNLPCPGRPMHATTAGVDLDMSEPKKSPNGAWSESQCRDSGNQDVYDCSVQRSDVIHHSQPASLDQENQLIDGVDPCTAYVCMPVALHPTHQHAKQVACIYNTRAPRSDG